jgi:hypothetical protein
LREISLIFLKQNLVKIARCPAFCPGGIAHRGLYAATKSYVKVTRSHHFVGYKLSWVRQNGAGLFSPAFLLQNLAGKTRRREKIA